MRKARQLLDGVTYHVTSKVNRGEYIFQNEENKWLFMEIVRMAKKRFKFILKHFVIMDNHIHLMICPLANENLSRIMQWILSVFAIYYNHINNISGVLWHGRFFSKIIKTSQQIIDTFKYISDNPVKAGLTGIAKNYAFSGLYFIHKKIFEIVEKPDKDFLTVFR